jgi:Zn-finger nucleic acid-binding protein
MTETINQTERNNWLCAACGMALQPGKVTISYLDNAYPVELLRCPRCGLTWVPEEIALGKMAEVEKTLEDK